METTVTKNMCKEQAVKIANNFFQVLDKLFRYSPVPIITSDGETSKIITLFCEENWRVSCGKIDEFQRSEDEVGEIVYKLIQNGRIYKIIIMDTDCIYVPDYKPDSLLCSIVEERDNGEPKYEMEFSFDIFTGKYIETFQLRHINNDGLVREYKDCCLNKEFVDKVIIKMNKESSEG